MNEFPSITALRKEWCDELHKYKARYLRTEFEASDARAKMENHILNVYQLISDSIKRHVMTRRLMFPIEQYGFADIILACIKADLETAGFNVCLIDRRPNGKDTLKTTTESLEITW